MPLVTVTMAVPMFWLLFRREIWRFIDVFKFEILLSPFNSFYICIILVDKTDQLIINITGLILSYYWVLRVIKG